MTTILAGSRGSRRGLVEVASQYVQSICPVEHRAQNSSHLRPTCQRMTGRVVEDSGLGSGTVTMTNCQRRGHCPTPVPFHSQGERTDKGLFAPLQGSRS